MLGLSCGIFNCGMWDLASWPGIKTGPPSLGMWSPSHWTTREAPFFNFFLKKYSRNKIIGNLKLQKNFLLLLLEGLEDYMAEETWQTRQRRNKSEWTREIKELMKSNVWIQKEKRQSEENDKTIKNNSQNWVSYLFKLESSTRYSAIWAQWTNPYVWCITVTF